MVTQSRGNSLPIVPREKEPSWNRRAGGGGVGWLFNILGSFQPGGGFRFVFFSFLLTKWLLSLAARILIQWLRLKSNFVFFFFFFFFFFCKIQNKMLIFNRFRFQPPLFVFSVCYQNWNLFRLFKLSSILHCIFNRPNIQNLFY